MGEYIVNKFTLPEGRSVEIQYDTCAENPRTDWDGNITTIYAWHRGYNIQDYDCKLDVPYSKEELHVDICRAVLKALKPGMEKGILANHLDWFYAYTNDGEDAKAEKALSRALSYAESQAFIYPVYMFDHGSIALSLDAFGDPWDSGQVGFAVVTREGFKAAMGKVTRWTAKQVSRVRECVRGEVETFSDYLNGNVYGVVVLDANGETEDSVWGFYGNVEEYGIEDVCSKEEMEYLYSTGQLARPKKARK